MAGLDTSAGTVLSLCPDWRRPIDWLQPLSMYIVEAPVDGDTCLCLDARSPGVPGAVIRDMVGRACDAIAQGGPFAEVLLVEDPVDLDASAQPVASTSELVDRLGLAPDDAEKEPATVVKHAQWAKRVVDRCQADLDRALFTDAPAVAADGEPLVTVRIATYGDPRPLVERTLPSVLKARYANIEVLVCGDGPHPATRSAVEGIGDPRVRYLELKERGPYPRRPTALWQTGGIPPMNRCLEEAQGKFIAPLDHDDVFLDSHIPELLAALGPADADFAYGRAITEYPSGSWDIVGSAPLRFGQVVHAAVLYSRRLLHMRYDAHSWLIGEPGDWNMWRRMAAVGAGMTFLPAPVAVHFREGTSMQSLPKPDPGRHHEDVARDVLETSARLLLGVASQEFGVRLDAV